MYGKGNLSITRVSSVNTRMIENTLPPFSIIIKLGIRKIKIKSIFIITQEPQNQTKKKG